MAHAIFGKYRLIAELGHGGMADVFLAVVAGPAGSRFRKLSVIKRLRQNLAEDPEFIAMLLEEARIASRLNHPNVVQTNEVSAVDDQYYIAMEYLDGQPLHRIQQRTMNRARTTGKATDPAIVDTSMVILMDALAGLHHAHDLLDYDGEPLEIVHRDVTPHNIFITYAGQVKVVDFGIAKAAGRAAETRQGIVKGKVRYMAPEHAAGRPIDRRADVFAVGVLLWETITGKRLWRDMDDMAIVQALTGNAPIRSPREVAPSLAPELERICLRALARDPAQRYETADAMRTDLEQYLADSGRLIAARRNVAQLVGTLFEDKRLEMKAIIEKQLAELEAFGSGEFEMAHLTRSTPSAPAASLTPTPPSRGTAIMVQPQVVPPPSSSIAPLEPLPGPGALPAVSSDRHSSGAPYSSNTPGSRSSSPGGVSAATKLRAERDQRARTILFALTLVMCTIAAGLAAALASRSSSVPAHASSTTPTSSAATAAQMPNVVTVRLDASPKDAHIMIDDGPPEEVPLVIRVAKDDREHRVRVEAPGYESKVESIPFANDLTAFIALEKKIVQSSLPHPPVVSPATTAGPAHKGPLAAGGDSPAPPATSPAPTSTSEYATPSGRPPKYERQNTKLDHNDPWKE